MEQRNRSLSFVSLGLSNLVLVSSKVRFFCSSDQLKVVNKYEVKTFLPVRI